MHQAERRAMWQGFGDGLSQAVELAVTPVLFALLGHLLDGRFGVRPVLTVTFFVFAVVGSFLRMWFHYLARSEAQDRDKAWNRTPKAVTR